MRSEPTRDPPTTRTEAALCSGHRGSRTHWTHVNMNAVIHLDHVLNACAQRAEMVDL